MDYHEFTKKAEALLVSTEFQQLSKALTLHEPNLWRILGVSARETRITRFLAWLLNPRVNHSLGDSFLKELVVQALRTEAGQQYQLNPVEVLVLDLAEAKVEIEYHFENKRRCDIVVSVPAKPGKPNSGFLCLIENKIWGKEAENQTIDYYTSSFKAFPVETYPNRVYIFLTPNDVPPQSEQFIPLSYQEVLHALHVVKQKHELADTEHFLIQQFQDNIIRGIAMDTKTVDLAQTIYEQHQEVIDFIVKCVAEEEESPLQGAHRVWDGKSRFFNVGEKADPGYKWSDYHRYGFICAGGDPPYRRIMERLKEGDLIYAYVSKYGYVGLGHVTKEAVPFREATLADGRQLARMPLDGQYDASEDDDKCDWIALVDWKYAVEKNKGVRMSPFTVSTSCKIYEHRQTETEQIRTELAEHAGQELIDSNNPDEH